MAFSFIPRNLAYSIKESLLINPATAILGPRQCGKSTLVRHILGAYKNALYLDLERPSDLQKLEDPEWFLSSQMEQLVCLDEIQRKPELFPLLRSLIDEGGRSGMYLILGSASRELIRQTSESLAGRISFKSLTPFLWSEVSEIVKLEDYLSRGGFPRSLLAANDKMSFNWRQDFITTFLERDLLQFAGFSSQTMRRMWQMLAHSNGQTLNLSVLGSALGVSHTTIRHYIDLLEETFMIRQLRPYAGNTKKRLMKSPKVYLADAGVSSALLHLHNFEQSAGHQSFGARWEGLVLANLYGHYPQLNYSFYRTNHGVETDIIASNGNLKIAIECKASVAPKLTKGNYSALTDIDPIHTFIAAPVARGYKMSDKIEIVGLTELIEKTGQMLNY